MPPVPLGKKAPTGLISDATKLEQNGERLELHQTTLSRRIQLSAIHASIRYFPYKIRDEPNPQRITLELLSHLV